MSNENKVWTVKMIDLERDMLAFVESQKHIGEWIYATNMIAKVVFRDKTSFSKFFRTIPLRFEIGIEVGTGL